MTTCLLINSWQTVSGSPGKEMEGKLKGKKSSSSSHVTGGWVMMMRVKHVAVLRGHFIKMQPNSRFLYYCTAAHLQNEIFPFGKGLHALNLLRFFQCLSFCSHEQNFSLQWSTARRHSDTRRSWDQSCPFTFSDALLRRLAGKIKLLEESQFGGSGRNCDGKLS